MVLHIYRRGWRMYICICNMYYLIMFTILGCILVLELSRPPQLYFYMCKSMNLCNTAGTHWTHKSMDKYSNCIKLYSYCLSIIRCITDNDCGLHKMNHCLFNATFTNNSVISSGWQFFSLGVGLGGGETGGWERKMSR